ncbi:hypothetical protein [Deinococcus humi]|uniref:Uncharacterized protein n=1 Tax=Deinococcus humi TaxID=662880 RepID=A0A7W8JU62_9DEIO|nr:hypothetical protein [Deinococcus humi]MBB5363261.1 hypothetical protein [Deinococcus humi]GGO27414.1 hypothetical protein GCM10008949_19060 [Deinococcus humi]
MFKTFAALRSRVSCTLLGTCLLSLGVVSVAGAQAAPANNSLFGLKFPSGYFNRFDRMEVVASNTDGYGARYLPVPIAADLRVTLVKTPTALNYGLGTQIGNLSVSVGVFGGVPRAEMSQYLPSGFQWTGLVQGKGALSRFALGYSHTENDGRFRILNAVGLAAVSGIDATYSYSEVSNFAPRSFGKLNTAVGLTGRLYTFPLQMDAQASFDLNLSANYSPLPGLVLEASHLERGVAGSVPIGDFGLGRVQASNFAVTYRLAGPETALRLGAVRSRVARNWTGDTTSVVGDIFLRSSALPSMLGPSVGYWWGPGGKDGHWMISLVALPK